MLSRYGLRPLLIDNTRQMSLSFRFNSVTMRHSCRNFDFGFHHFFIHLFICTFCSKRLSERHLWYVLRHRPSSTLSQDRPLHRVKALSIIFDTDASLPTHCLRQWPSHLMAHLASVQCMYSTLSILHARIIHLVCIHYVLYHLK